MFRGDLRHIRTILETPNGSQPRFRSGKRQNPQGNSNNSKIRREFFRARANISCVAARNATIALVAITLGTAAVGDAQAAGHVSFRRYSHET